MPDTNEGRHSADPGIDYSPKTYTLREQIVFGAKLLVIGGILLLMFWLFEK